MVVGLADVGIERVLFHQRFQLGVSRRSARRRRLGAGKHAFGRFLARAVDEARRHAIGEADDLAFVVGTEQVLRHHDVLGLIAAHHEQLRIGTHHLVDLGFERGLLAVDDDALHFHALRLDGRADCVEHRLGERRLRHDQVGALRAHRENDAAELLALQFRVRLGAHEIPLVRQQRERVRRRDREHHHLIFPAERQHRGAHRGSPHAHDRLRLVDVDQLARGALAGFGVGLVVLGEVLDLAPEQSACRVHLIHHGLMRHAAVRPEWRAGAGERDEAGELDRAGLSEARRGDDERCRDGADTGEQRLAAGDERTFLHDFPLLVGRMIAAISRQGTRDELPRQPPKCWRAPRARSTRRPAGSRDPQLPVRRARSVRP